VHLRQQFTDMAAAINHGGHAKVGEARVEALLAIAAAGDGISCVTPDAALTRQSAKFSGRRVLYLATHGRGNRQRIATSVVPLTG
jgi:hypothetical protein